MTVKKKALYVRVSTEMQVEGYSIDTQIELLENFIKSKEWKDYEIYKDLGYSGKSLERPAIKKLIKDCEEGKIDVVLVFKLDRISRSQKDTLYLIEEIFNKYQVGFISIRENFDTTTPFGKAMIGILSVFAQLERETILERTRLGLKKRAEEGYWRGGGKIPFAYDYDKKTGVLVVNKERKKDFDLLKELRLQGYSYQELSRITGYDESWIQNILKNKTNLGYIPYKGNLYIGKHRAIITQEEYDELQQIENNKRKNHGIKHYLLSSKIYCGECGAKYRYQKWGKRVLCYCYSQQKSKPNLIRDKNCSNLKIDSYKIENSILNQLFKMQLDKTLLTQKKYFQDIDVKKELYQKLRKLKNKMKVLISLSETLPLEEIQKEIRKINYEKKEIEDKLHNYKKNKETIKELDKDKDLKELWNLLTFIEKRTIIDLLIDKVIIKKTKLEIYWNLY
ncbi:MAG: recombinase family protein [Firmicutes bacterium]|nr:recombinase family protein [Bacillota bacterium]